MSSRMLLFIKNQKIKSIDMSALLDNYMCRSLNTNFRNV